MEEVAGKVERWRVGRTNLMTLVVTLSSWKECPRYVRRGGAWYERTEAFQAVEAKGVIRPAKLLRRRATVGIR